MHDLVERKIGEIFEHKLNLRVPSPAIDLFESGSLDSLSFVDLLLHLETEYSIRIPLEDLEISDFRSVESIARFIRRRLGAEIALPAPAVEYTLLEPQPEPEPQPQPEPQYLYMEAKCPA